MEVIVAAPGFCISTFKSYQDTAPHLKSFADFNSFVTSLKKIMVTKDKFNVTCFSPALFKSGTTRKNANVVEIGCAVLDFDDVQLEEIEKKITEENWSGLVVSTHSYSDLHPYFRVILECSRPFTAEEWKCLHAVLHAQLGFKSDKRCKDPARLYLMPSKRTAQSESYSKHFKGKPVDVDALLKEGQPGQRKNGSGGGGSQETTVREMADFAFVELFARRLWYVNGGFRYYDEGYWQLLSEEDEKEVIKAILLAFPLVSAKAAIAALETLRYLAIRDARPNHEPLICLKNGVLDLDSGKLLRHRADLNLLWALDVDWDGNATAPRFQQFLKEIWGNEPDYKQRVSFIQEWLGYLILNSSCFERFLWMVGKGANGKSVLLKIMRALVGTENVSHAMLERLGRPAVRAELDGKLLNISSEISVNASLADGYLKAIVSGETIEAERKYHPSFSFTPTVKLVAATNELPKLLDRSNGFGRRAVILTFNHTIPVKDRDPNLADQIIEHELQGVLKFAVDGLIRLMSRGHFQTPSSSDKELQIYRESADVVGLFVAECLDVGKEHRTDAKRIYDAFKTFASSRGYSVCNIGEFGRRLSTHNVGRIESNSRTYRHAKLLAEYEEMSGETIFC